MYYNSYSGGLSGMLLLIGIAGLVGALLLAFEFSNVAAEKGYTGTRKYFWYSFLFSIGGWLLVCALPDRNAHKPAVSEEKQKQHQDDELEKALKF